VVAGVAFVFVVFGSGPDGSIAESIIGDAWFEEVWFVVVVMPCPLDDFKSDISRRRVIEETYTLRIR
jgi:hypothetical protein